MALWGFSSLPMYPTIMKAWTPIVLLMSARNALITFGSLRAFLIHGERGKYKQAVWRKEILTFSFLHPLGLPHSIHLPASAFPTFPACSGLQGLWSKPEGMWPDMRVSPVWHLTASMPVRTPYVHVARRQHLSDDISCGICGFHVAVVL